MQNLQISIPIAVVAGIIALLLVWALVGGKNTPPLAGRLNADAPSAIKRGCCRRNKNKNAPYRFPRGVPPPGGRRPDSQEGLMESVAVGQPCVFLPRATARSHGLALAESARARPR